MIRLSRTEFGLLAATIIPVVWLLYEGAAPYPHFEPLPAPPAAPIAEPAAVQTAFVAPPIGDFSEIDVRPLFSPLRKPQKAAAPADAAQILQPPLPDLALIGIVIGPDDRFAILRAVGATAVRNVRIGQDVGGWKLTKIEAEYIVLRVGASDREMRLRPRYGDPASGVEPLSASAQSGFGEAPIVSPGSAR